MLSCGTDGALRLTEHRGVHGHSANGAEIGEQHQCSRRWLDAVWVGLRVDNEVHKLQDRINALPLDLLKSTVPAADGDITTPKLQYCASRSNTYLVTSTRWTNLGCNAMYQRCTAWLMLCGVLQRNLSVVRQFTVAIYFSGPHAAGSPVFRAASCAWLCLALVKSRANEIDSLYFGMAVGVSELGHGNDKDIYPGLYVQSAR